MIGILWAIIIGFVVGLIARAIKPGDDNMGIIATTALGIGGSMLAGLIGRAMGLYEPGEMVGFFASVIGAILVLFLVNMFRKPHRTGV